MFKWSCAFVRSRARTRLLYIVYLVWRIFTKGIIYVRDAPLSGCCQLKAIAAAIANA